MSHLPVKLTKLQMVLLAAFAVAVLAFVLDRVYPGLGPGRPDPAQAAGLDLGAILPASAAAFPKDLPGSRPTDPRSLLAEHLEEISQAYRLADAKVPDAFHPSSSWVPRPLEPKPKPQPPKPKQDPVARFVAAHRLQAVVVGDQAGGAIIDGRYVTIGEEIDGFKLISVAPESVVFVRQGLRAVLTLNGRSNGR